MSSSPDGSGNSRADNVIRNIGAAAEASALFYNTVAKQVPAEVAVELTKQYMAVTFQPNRPTKVQIPQAVIQDAVKKALDAEARRKEEERRRREQEG